MVGERFNHLLITIVRYELSGCKPGGAKELPTCSAFYNNRTSRVPSPAFPDARAKRKVRGMEEKEMQQNQR